MNVSGVTPSSGIYTYNSIRLNELRGRQIVAARKQRHTEEVAEQAGLREEQDSGAVRSVSVPKPEQNYTSFDYAKEYRTGETYEMKGVDADINKLDMTKAVSDLEKDQILLQYQFFIGDASYAAAKENAKEMAFFSGENFIL